MRARNVRQLRALLLLLLLGMVVTMRMLFPLPVVQVINGKMPVETSEAYENKVNKAFENSADGFSPTKHRLQQSGHGLLINTSSCQIPDMQAFSSVAKQYSRPPLPMHCSRRMKQYRTNQVVQEPGHVSEPKRGFPVPRGPPPGLKCCFRDIHRHERHDNYKTGGRCRPMELLVAPPDRRSDSSSSEPEYVRVSCYRREDESGDVTLEELAQGDEEFVDVHSFVPIKDEVEWRCNLVVPEEGQLSIVIMGVDSVSRLNMLRQLPRTFELLTSAPLLAEPLLGYNKVADNTFPNLIPLLTGYSVEELPRACGWRYTSNPWSHKFDSCPIIWKDYADKGFRTMYGEECPHLSTFNFKKAGFYEQPTDYYPRPMLLAATDYIGHTSADNCILCLGRRSSVEILMDYTTQFVKRFSQQRHFSFSWATSLTHDNLNMAGLADKIFYTTLKGMIKRGDLKNSALFFVSDHGIRTGDFRLTPQGRLEERLPFVAVAFPEWFQNSFPLAIANLRFNARSRLTTPFDIHETLKDLLSPSSNMKDQHIKSRTQQLRSRHNMPRGISLFLEIPEERDCSDAGIPRHWCTCLSYRPLDLDNPRLMDAAEALVEHINKRFLSSYPSCAHLKLERVVEARIGTAAINNGTFGTSEDGISDYAFTVETTPGGALFEGAVRSYSVKGRNNKSRVKFEVADTISRLNKYGSQSDCVDEWVVKLYCYCKHQEY